MRALGFNLIAAIIAFVVGTVAASVRFTANDFPQATEELSTAISATLKAPRIDQHSPPFPGSNISRIASMLNQLVEAKGTAKSNTFYVEEVDEEALGGRFTRVYWKENRAVIIISPPYDAADFPLEWTYSRRINLDHHVVPTAADVGTSNYLVSRPWIEEVLKKCVRNGVKITIAKSNAQSNEGSKTSGCDDPQAYSLEEDPETNSLKIVSGGAVLHTIKLLSDSERNGYGFNGAKKTKDGFELSIEYGSRIYYGKTFIFICRHHQFYLSKIAVESFDKHNPEKWSRRVIQVRPNVPLEKFSLTDFMLEGVVQINGLPNYLVVRQVEI